MGQTLDCFCKGIEFTRSHRPGEVIPDSYDKCEPGLNSVHVHDRIIIIIIILIHFYSAISRSSMALYKVSKNL